MDFRILGPVEARLGGEPAELGQPGTRLILGLLLLEPNVMIPAERLIRMAWGDRPPATARASLHNRVAALRTRLPAPAGATVVTRAPGYLVRVDPARVDAHVFTAQVGQARQATDPAARAEILDGALQLWRGPLLADVIDDASRWRFDATLCELRVSAIELHAQAELDSGHHERLLNWLVPATREHPSRERLVASLMIALARAGRLSEALAVYRDTRRRLDQDLGIRPGRALDLLHEQLLRDDPAAACYDRPARGRPAVLRPVPPAGSGPPAAASGPPATPLAQPARRLIPRELPAASGHFIGRDQELTRLSDLLTPRPPGAAPAAVAVTGAGGIGKTALAIQVAAAISIQFPDGQFYIDLQGGTDDWLRPDAVLSRFLLTLGVSPQVLPAGTPARAALFRDVTAGRRILLVLDNALDERQVRDLMPGTPGSAVLMTARRRLTALPDVTIVDLDTLHQASSVAILAAMAGQPRIDAEPQAARAIADLCGQLPLALRIAGAQLAARPHRSLRETAERLGDERARLDQLAVADLDVRGSISTSWRALCPADQVVGRRLGLVDFPDFPAWVAHALAGGPASSADASLDRLVDARLVEFAGEGPDGRARFRLHDLVRLYARERAGAEETDSDVQLAHDRLLDAYLSLAVISRNLYFENPSAGITVPITHPPAAPPCAPDLNAMIACLDAESRNVTLVISQALARGAYRQGWQLPFLLFGFFNSGRHMDESVAAAELGIRAATAAHDPQAQRIMFGHHAAICRNANLSEQALDSLQRVLELARTAGHRRAEGFAYCGISSASQQLRRYAEALSAFHTAEAILREVGDDFARSMLLSNASSLCTAMGRPDLARRYAAEAIDLARSSSHPEALARARVHLAGCLRSADPPGAHVLLDQAAGIARRLGTTDLEIAISCVRALLAMDAGAMDAALALLDQAAELSQATGNIRKEAGVLGCRGLVHLRTGDESAAARCLALAGHAAGPPAAAEPGGELSLALGDLALRGYTDA